MVIRGRWDLLLFGASCLTACGGGGDDEDKGPKCPTSATTPIQLGDVSPAPGASVTNNAIQHTFTTLGVDFYSTGFGVAPLQTHTAGSFPANTVVMITPVPRASGSGQDWRYSFTVTWPTAPAHVAFFAPTTIIDPEDDCKYSLPSPLFEYDITP